MPLGVLILAVISIEIEDLNTSLLVFLGFGVLLSIVFNYLNAPYLSMFQFMVYSGIALIMLFEIEVEEGKSKLKLIKQKKSHLVILAILFFILVTFFSLGNVNSTDLSAKSLNILFKKYLWEKKRITTLSTILVLLSSSIAVLFLHEER